MTSDPQYVYFIRPVGMDGPIKIGCSTKPVERLKVLAAWSPFELEIIGTVPGDFADEGRLHRRFSDLHTRKEWFMSSPLLRHTIERVLSGISIKDVCKEIAPKRSIKGQKRPIKTPDRARFLQYGNAIRNVVRPLYDKQGSYYAPEYIKKIMHDWRSDRFNGHVPIAPTAEQLALLDEFIADPKPRCVYREWSVIRGEKPEPSLAESAAA